MTIKNILWCHIRHTNQVKVQPEGITQKNKEVINDFNDK